MELTEIPLKKIHTFWPDRFDDLHTEF